MHFQHILFVTRSDIYIDTYLNLGAWNYLASLADFRNWSSTYHSFWQETKSLPLDEIMDIICHSMPTTWKDKMSDQDFYSAESIVKEMTDFFVTRIENLEPKEDKKKYSVAVRKKKDKKALHKRKWADSKSRVEESREDSSIEHRHSKKVCIQNRSYSHSTDTCKDLQVMINKYRHRKYHVLCWR